MAATRAVRPGDEGAVDAARDERGISSFVTASVRRSASTSSVVSGAGASAARGGVRGVVCVAAAGGERGGVRWASASARARADSLCASRRRDQGDPTPRSGVRGDRGGRADSVCVAVVRGSARGGVCCVDVDEATARGGVVCGGGGGASARGDDVGSGRNALAGDSDASLT
jgi:hypothetical protein